MTFSLVVNFNNSTSKTFNVDTYSHANGALELFNCNGNVTTITLFPFEVIASVIITQIGV